MINNGAGVRREGGRGGGGGEGGRLYRTATFFTRVNTRLLSYRRNENARRRQDAERRRMEGVEGTRERERNGKGEPTGQCISG